MNASRTNEIGCECNGDITSPTSGRLSPSRRQSVQRSYRSCFRHRFSHLQHGVAILLVCELTRNLPAVTEIESHGNRIRLDDAKAACPVTTGTDLSLALRQQSASNPLSAMLSKYPQIANPFLIRYDHAHDLVIRNCHPCQRPILVFELQGNGLRSEKILECFIRHCLYQALYRSVFAGLRSANNQFTSHPRILVERHRLALK